MDQDHWNGKLIHICARMASQNALHCLLANRKDPEFSNPAPPSRKREGQEPEPRDPENPANQPLHQTVNQLLELLAPMSTAGPATRQEKLSLQEQVNGIVDRTLWLTGASEADLFSEGPPWAKQEADSG